MLVIHQETMLNIEIIKTDSENGFVVFDGSIATFTPDLDFNGTTTFTYLVTDGELTSNSSIVTIVVIYTLHSQRKRHGELLIRHAFFCSS